ncbi:diacylglycerol kinase family protein [Lentibacillus salinarum]|uniref:Diacylglycerol kinase family protein n=1 Tax=Lentibacillus salinarum TaxID=446820 RepID=A0ABW3ZX71_9BACI
MRRKCSVTKTSYWVNSALNAKRRKSLIGLTHAWNGLKTIFCTERNFRIHIMTVFAVMAAGIVLQLPIIKWAIIIVVIGLVLVAEMLNTAVEKMLDYVKPTVHPQAKVIKDIAAGAVLVAAVVAVIVGLLVFLPEFREW